ncbi:hypothetical protein V2J09_008829 [Rumex salicifolius]
MAVLDWLGSGKPSKSHGFIVIFFSYSFLSPSHHTFFFYQFTSPTPLLLPHSLPIRIQSAPHRSYAINHLQIRARLCTLSFRVYRQRSFFRRFYLSRIGTYCCLLGYLNSSMRSTVMQEEMRDQHHCSDSSSRVFTEGIKRLECALAAVLVAVQISSPLPLSGLDEYLIPPAKAVLYSPDTKVPRTGELALRRAIPANTSMKTIQESLEDISYLLRIPQRKPYGTMEGNVKKALKVAKDEKDTILSSMPMDLKDKGSVLYTSLIDGKGGLEALLKNIKDKDADKVSLGLASALDTVAELELLQGCNFCYRNNILTGRGIVEFTIEKGDGSAFLPEAGVAKSTATIQVVIDGFSAPLTAGNFVKLVIDGVYNGTKLSITDQAVLSDSTLDRNTGYSIPLEIKPSGQFEPLYKTTLSVQDGELPVLPLSVYGAIVMAHNDVSEEYSSPNQFFFYLYDKRNSGLGGLSFDEGQFSVFGYTTVGRDILPQIKTGDIIRSAKLVEGQERLILPPSET